MPHKIPANLEPDRTIDPQPRKTCSRRRCREVNKRKRQLEELTQPEKELQVREAEMERQIAVLRNFAF